MPHQAPKHIKPPWPVVFSIFAGLLVLFLVVFGYSLWVLESVREQAEKENLAAVQAQTNLGVLFVADHQRSLLNRLAAIASRDSFKRAVMIQDMGDLHAYLLPLIEQSQEIVDAFFSDHKGRVLLSVPQAHDLQILAGDLPQDVPGSAPLPWVSPVRPAQEGDIVTLSAPAWGHDDRLLGFLAVHQPPTLWRRFFSNLSARPGRSFHLFDQQGNQVATGPELISAPDKAVTALASRVRQEVDREGAAVTRLDDQPGHGRKAFVSASPVSKLGWVLVVAQDEALAMAPTRALSQNIWLFLLVLLMCLVLMGFLLATRYRMQQQSLIETDQQARRLEAEVNQRTADLKASTDRYRTLLEDLPDIVYEVDATGCITLISGATRDLLSYDPEDMIGQPIRHFVLPEDRYKFDEERSHAEQGQEMNILALRHLSKHGHVRWLSIHSRGITDGQGRFMGRRGVARDVTQQILAEIRVSELSGKLINAQEEERKRLALDLHDELGQLLSALKIGLQSLAGEMPPGETRELERLIRLSQTIMDRVRALAYNLRPAILDNFGLVAAVQDLCDSLAEAGLLQTECSFGEIGVDLPDDVKLPLFRCVQEALHNVVKHSHSPWAEVELDCRQGFISLEVRDHGCGFDPQQAMEASHGGKHLGLLGMRERLRLIGGHLKVQSSEKGTTLKAEVPLGEEL